MAPSSSADDDNILTIELVDSRDLQMHFEVDKEGSFETVFHKYSQFKGLPLDSLQFTYNGKTINAKDDTPASLGMISSSNDGDNKIKVSLSGHALTKEQIEQACTSGSTSTAVDLLAKHKELCSEPITWFDSDGQELVTPPIFICIDYGHSELVEQLLPLYKDILDTLMGGDGEYSALQWASWTGHLEIVKILIEKGTATADEEALSLAREDDHNDVAEYLLKHIDMYANLKGDSDGIMEKACREGDMIMVRKLLEDENYDVSKWKDEDGKYLAFSPMYLAVKHGHMDVVQLFAEKGVQVDMDVAAPSVTE